MTDLPDPTPERELPLVMALAALGGWCPEDAEIERVARAHIPGALPSTLHNALNRAFDGLTAKGFFVRYGRGGRRLTVAGRAWCARARVEVADVPEPPRLFED